MIRKAACISAIAAGVIGLGIIPAAASAATGPHKVPVVYYQYRAIDKKYEGRHSGDWVVCGHGVNSTGINGVTFTCSETVTTSTSASITGGYTAKEISGAIGFSISISYTFSKSLGLSVPLRAHTQADIDFGIYYGRFRVRMEKRKCSTVPAFCGHWSNPSWVTIQHAVAPAIGAFHERRA